MENKLENMVSGDALSGGKKLSVGSGQSFLSYMSTITEQDKYTLMNLGQYVLLAIIPITILLKLLKRFTPVEDPTKGTIELTIEVVVQLLAIVFALYFIHKMIVYLPTYSKRAYEGVNLLTMILPFVFILFTLETNIGDKMNTLLERVLAMIGLSKEPFEDEEQQQESIHTPPSLALEPPVSSQLMPPMNTQPEMGNPSMNNMGTQNQPMVGSSMLQNDVMAAGGSFGAFAPF
jgi:hypothetical protein